MEQQVLEFINRRFPSDSNWMNGNCFYFALILSFRFNGDIYYDCLDGHFLSYINGEYYDYTGKRDSSDFLLIKFDQSYKEYDPLHYSVIVRDCIN